jgi:homoserine kinase
VFNVQRSALVVAAMTTGDWDLLGEAMQDRMHQPYRAPLIPGLEQALAVRAEGLVATALSGAGPTVLVLARTEAAESVGQEVRKVFGEHGVGATVHVSDVDREGRTFY